MTTPVIGAAVVFTSKLDATVAVICVVVTLKTGSVACVGPRLNRTSDPPVGSDIGMKLAPVTVSVNDAPPAVAALGEIAVIDGTGLAAGLIKNVSVFDSPLFPAPENGFSVLTATVPAFAIIAAVTVAVTLLALTKVVGMVLPFHCTTVCVTNPPDGLATLSVNAAPPALACDGAMKLTAAPVGTWNVFP